MSSRWRTTSARTGMGVVVWGGVVTSCELRAASRIVELRVSYFVEASGRYDPARPGSISLRPRVHVQRARLHQPAERVDAGEGRGGDRGAGRGVEHELHDVVARAEVDDARR